MVPPSPARTFLVALRGGPFAQLLLVVPVCVAAIPVSIVVACQWRAVREAEAEARLKCDLADRGLTSAEIDRLTRRTFDRSSSSDGSYYQIQHAQLETSLGRDLALRGLPADEVQGVLRAWNAGVPPSGQCSWESFTRAQKEADFIRQLLDQKRPAKEIERHLQMSHPAAAEARRAEAEAALKVLRRSGMTADELQRALAPADAAAARMPREP